MNLLRALMAFREQLGHATGDGLCMKFNSKDADSVTFDFTAKEQEKNKTKVNVLVLTQNAAIHTPGHHNMITVTFDMKGGTREEGLAPARPPKVSHTSRNRDKSTAASDINGTTFVRQRRSQLHIDEAYMRVRSRWRYLYRAIDGAQIPTACKPQIVAANKAQDALAEATETSRDRKVPQDPSSTGGPQGTAQDNSQLTQALIDALNAVQA